MLNFMAIVYVVGAKKRCFLKPMSKKIFTVLRSNIVFNCTYAKVTPELCVARIESMTSFNMILAIGAKVPDAQIIIALSYF